jgi:cytochrome c556
MVQGLEARLLELAGDVLTALGKGELAADAPVVRAAAAALAELRRVPEASPASAAAPGTATAAGAVSERERRGGRAAPPAVEQLLGVAAHMRAERRSFAAACGAVAHELGTSAQAVRNSCTRWLGASAAEWQPLLVDGGEAGVVALARRVAERCPWLADRIGREFGVSAAALAGATSH